MTPVPEITQDTSDLTWHLHKVADTVRWRVTLKYRENRTHALWLRSRWRSVLGGGWFFSRQTKTCGQHQMAAATLLRVLSRPWAGRCHQPCSSPRPKLWGARCLWAPTKLVLGSASPPGASPTCPGQPCPRPQPSRRTSPRAGPGRAGAGTHQGSQSTRLAGGIRQVSPLFKAPQLLFPVRKRELM